MIEADENKSKGGLDVFRFVELIVFYNDKIIVFINGVWWIRCSNLADAFD